MGMIRAFYRVEHPHNRKGPYSSGDCRRICDELKEESFAYSLSRRGKHPSPGDDPGIAGDWRNLTYDDRSRYRFGFSNAYQFRDWFYSTDFLLKLNALGYRLAIYLVDTYSIGHSQMIASTKGKYQLVEDVDLTLDGRQIENIAMGAIAERRAQEKEKQKAAKKAERNAKRRAQYAAKKAKFAGELPG